MNKLFSSYKIKDLVLKNRIVMAPMCMDSAIDGYANDFHYIHYASRAIGGAGLILVEATGVESCGRITMDDLGLWDDSQIDGLKNIVDVCHQYGSKVGIQLNHAGRKSEVWDEEIIGPSSLAFSEDYKTPIEMTGAHIKRVINSFKEGARRAHEAGFDVIEIHGAHGYLISEFLSPLTNKREDNYGGSALNRTNFLKEVIIAIKEVWPQEKPLFLRVSADDYAEGGNCAHSMAELLNIVKDYGIDVVDVSTGGVVPAKPETYPGYQTRHSETIKEVCNIPTISGGLITTSSMAEELLCNNRCDLVFLGRELLRNPYWPLQASKELEAEIEWPKQYLRSKVVRKNGF